MKGTEFGVRGKVEIMFTYAFESIKMMKKS